MQNMPSTTADSFTGGDVHDLVAVTNSVMRQFVSFFVADQEFAVDIGRVKEIRGWSETTAVPASPSHMRGVVNLRGTIVPIFDLRARFSMGLTAVTAKHVVIIVTIGGKVVGLLVDAVSDILTVSEADIRAVPNVSGGSSLAADALLSGLVAVNEKMVAIIQLETVLSGSDMPSDVLQQISSSAALAAQN